MADLHRVSTLSGCRAAVSTIWRPGHWTQRRLWKPGVAVGGMLAVAGVFLVVAAFVAGCGGVRPSTPLPEVRVTSFSPVIPPWQGSGSTSALRLRFSRAAVPEEQVGQTLASPPVIVVPPVSMAGSWADRQTLVLRPLSELRPSTSYTVSVKPTVPGLTGKRTFTFVHRPLQLERISGVDLKAVPPKPTFVLHFNQPVSAKAAASACSLTRGEGADQSRIGLRTGDGSLVLRAVHLRPRATLARGQSYSLRCDKLAGHGGNVTMQTPFARSIATYPAFSLLSSGPDGSAIPADEVPVTLTFSTPVRLDTLRKALAMSPHTPAIRRGSLDSSGTRYTAVMDLRTTTAYTVRLSGKLADIHGQKLGKSRRFAFTTSDAAPRLVMERGIYAVEARGKGYPVWTRNVKNFELACAPVPKKRLVRVLTSGMNYDPWWGGSQDADVTWKQMGLKKRARKLTVKQAKNKWQLSSLKLSGLCGAVKKGSPRGVFLAELRSDQVKPSDSYRYRPRQRVLANVTDLGVLLKVGPSSGVVWVTSISGGKPVPKAKVTVYTTRGKRAFVGTTDARGLLALPGTVKMLRQPGADQKDDHEEQSFEDYDLYRAQRVIAVVEKGSDLAVVDGNWQNGIQIWNFGVPVDRRGGKARIRGFIQSDRGIYRPGEKVHFKGLVRQVSLADPPKVPKRRYIAVTVDDARGATIYKKSLKISSFGGFAFDLGLDKECSLGDYTVTATLMGQTFRERFSVEEFRKVTYELSMRGHERHTAINSKQKLRLEANYLFGAPVKDAKVQWSVHRRPHPLHFAKFPGYAFADHAAAGRYSWWWDRSSDRYLSFVTDDEGTTDERGRALFSFRDSERKLDGPQDYIVQATVTDETDQSVSKRAVITGHHSDIYLGMHAQEYVQAVDMPFAVNTVALTPGGQQVEAEATLSLIHERRVCSTSGGYRSYRTCKRRLDRVWTRKVSIGKTGTGVERIVPKKPGEYIIRLEGKDSRGRKVAASTYVWVIGKGEAFWSGDESARLSLIAGKRQYRPGETARLVPRTNLSGATALVTLERGGVLDAFVVPLKSSGQGIQIPLSKNHAPNVYASVALVRGRVGRGDRNRPRFKLGVIELKVAADAQRLEVKVSTNAETVEPGEKVTGTIRVTSAGAPVQAEVALSAADEGVLQLIAYKTPNPMKSFYAPFGLGIDSSTNLNRIARLSDPAALDPDEGGDAGEDEGGQKVRSRFVSSAYWAPALLTNADGEASFSFTAPDNLTAFRLMAVAADTGARFGSGQSRLTVSKPLLAKPVLPRFLSAGDKVEIGVMVHNYSDYNGKVKVRARASGLKLSASRRTVRLKHGQSTRVRFNATVGFVKKATVRFDLSMGEHGDAVRVSLPINRPVVSERRTVASGIVNGKTEVPLSWPDDLLLRDSRLEISVDRTGMAELEGGLRYLIEYPYGCLEQTLSRFIPLTKVQDLAKSMGFRSLTGAKARAFIKAGAAKVARHQHDTGHFSLWPGSRAYPHLTTYAMFGLNEARRAGVKVDQLAVKRGIAAMKKWANEGSRTLTPGGEIATMAMAAFVLADLGQADAGLNARLYEARAALPYYGKAFLLRALHGASANQGQIETLVAELAKVASVGGNIAKIKEKTNGRETFDWVHFYMSSDVRSSAIVLSALLSAAPNHKLVEPLAEGLLAARQQNGRWINTQENIYSLVALSDLARRKAAGRSRVKVRQGRKTLISKRISGTKVASYGRSLRRLGAETLTIESDSPVRYSVRLRQVRKVSQAEAVSRGFALKREYLDSEGLAPITSVAAGQLVKVKLTVSTDSNRTYVALSDPLPGGFEILNTRLATTQQQRPVKRPTRRWWWSQPVWVHKEMRDDRYLAFSDVMSRGTHTVEYTVRATIPGTFTAPPTTVEMMYQPDVMARTAVSSVEVTK